MLRWYNPIRDRAEEDEYPRACVHEAKEYAETELGEPIMEFRLTYQGPLFADRGKDDNRQSRLIHKHSIRRRFHEQLGELWKTDSRLKNLAKESGAARLPTGEVRAFSTYLEAVGAIHESGGIKWVPLATEGLGSACSLNILFLRHEPVGGIIQSGDLDNRIKTLFDSLRIPKEKEIPDDIVPQEEPDPYFCLMSDDQLITDFRVTADRLLVPSQKSESDSDVHLIIEVRTFIVDHEKASFKLGGHIHR